MLKLKMHNLGRNAAIAAVPLMLAPSLVLGATTYERARVVGVSPVYETVSYDVPMEQCREEQVRYVEPRHHRASATPTIVGAIIGGALGHAVGHHKRNKQVGTAVGALLGGSIGRDIGRRHRGYDHGQVRYRTEQVCNVVSEIREEERLAGYDVSYVYGGETYSTRMSRDPGEYIRVRVSVSPAQH